MYMYMYVDDVIHNDSHKVSPPFAGGRMSANELWAILRDESQTKLLREDAKIPRELKVKVTLSAFAL